MDDPSDAADIARRWGGNRAGSGWLCRCPVPSHGRGRGDRNPSLSIRDGDVPGRIIVHCFAGCDGIAVLEALRDYGHLARAASPTPRPGRVVAAPAPRAEPEPDSGALELWRAGEALA